MTSTRQGRIPGELGWLVDELDGISERLRTLEAPSGEALSSTVAKLQSLVEDIQAQLDAWTASRWTNAQIDARIDSKVAAYVSAILAGNVTIGGSITVNGTVNVPGARATGLSTASDRVVAWLAGDGRLGHTAS